MDKFSELKAAAMAATPGRIGDRIDGSGSIKYECTGYDGSLVLRTDHKDMEYGFVGDNADADELFFRLCVPDVVLTLLAELEAKDKRITTVTEESEFWRERVDGAEKEREEFRRRFNLERSCLEDADKRIAELEAKTAMTMGVGSGNGSLFVHGDYDSIKAAQAIVLENESLRAKLATPVRLPRPACTYADHSYPAYSRKQVEEIITSAGMRFTVEGDSE